MSPVYPILLRVSVFIICSLLCVYLGVVNVCAVCEFWVYPKVVPRTFGCVAMCSAVLFIKSRLLVYSARSGVNRVQVVLSGFNVMYGCMYFFAAFVIVYVDVMSSA